MTKTQILLVLVPLLSLLPFNLALTQDFCVADLNSSDDTPAGYPCKPQASATADDFHYRGLAAAGPSGYPFNTSTTFDFVQQFPALNGLGLGATLFDVAPGGVVPLHTHPRGSEIIFVLEGKLNAGVISADTNAVYAAKLVSKGELFVIPQGLLHFLYNGGDTPAVAFAAYSSPDPGAQVLDLALFGSNLKSPVVEKVTFLDDAEVERLKAMFGSG